MTLVLSYIMFNNLVSPAPNMFDNVSVRVKSEFRFHIILLKPCWEPISQILVHRLDVHLELKRHWRLVHCKRPDIPPAGLVLLSVRMCKLSVRLIPRKISLASSVISCEVHFRIVCIIVNVLWNPVFFVLTADSFFVIFQRHHAKIKGQLGYLSCLSLSFNLLQLILTVIQI